MAVNKKAFLKLTEELKRKSVTLVAVSKTRSIEDILELYDLGQRDFGENYVQEMVKKAERLPHDIRWHFIGHLQTNKVKLITPFVQLIHGVDSLKLLKELNKQAGKAGRVVDCLLQVHIAQEETKFGLDEQEVNELLNSSIAQLHHVKVCGLMGMASFTEHMEVVRKEFRNLKGIFDSLKQLLIAHCPLPILSTGMSADYKVAVEEGSNMVRIGTLLFGEREKK